jgi:hypothetical protein
MTSEEARKLKPGDRITGIRSRDPFLAGHWYKGEVIRLTEHAVLIQTNNPEDPPNGDLYLFNDPRLALAHSLGPGEPGEPWLEAKTKRKLPKRPKGRRSRRGGGRR